MLPLFRLGGSLPENQTCRNYHEGCQDIDHVEPLSIVAFFGPDFTG